MDTGSREAGGAATEDSAAAGSVKEESEPVQPSPRVATNAKTVVGSLAFTSCHGGSALPFDPNSSLYLFSAELSVS